MEKAEKYDILIVGAGISGATLAERFATQLQKKVLIIEQRDHIGGNCYDYYNDDGILVPKYGPHFFHTNLEQVWNYVSTFTEWNMYEHRALSRVSPDVAVPIPVNITTVNKIFGTTITSREEMQAWLTKHTSNIAEPKNSEEAALRRVGKELYELMFKNYTIKQWDIHPKHLDPSVMDRIPVRSDFEDRYFTDTYQGMPKHGYTKLFENMLRHNLITVKLSTGYEAYKEKIHEFEYVFFTGRIDLFFGNNEGKNLQYRSLKFIHETIEQEYFQERAVINYPNDQNYTRITEPKHATGQVHPKTTIIKETSTWEGEPYYPVPSKENKELYTIYKNKAKMLEKKRIFFVGRLAEYKYFNMDQAFENALSIFEKIKKEMKKEKHE